METNNFTIAFYKGIDKLITKLIIKAKDKNSKYNLKKSKSGRLVLPQDGL